jgi:hypothetical protein
MSEMQRMLSVVFCVGGMVALYGLSTALGCDFWTLMRALPLVVGVVMLAWLAVFRLDLDAFLVCAVAAAIIWLCLFGVIDSIALGGIDPSKPDPMPFLRERSAWPEVVKWGG